MSVEDNDTVPEWDGLPINIRIGRGEHGWWWAVYFSDGGDDLPGSLWGGAGTYGDIGECYAEAYYSYLRAFEAHPPRYETPRMDYDEARYDARR